MQELSFNSVINQTCITDLDNKVDRQADSQGDRQEFTHHPSPWVGSIEQIGFMAEVMTQNI